MRTCSLVLIAAVSVAVTVSVLDRLSAQTSTEAPPPSPPPGAARIAVCDIVELFNNYQRAKDLNKEFAEKREAIAAEDKDRQDKIKQLEQMVDALRPGSKEQEANLAKLEELTLERSVWLKLQEQKIIRKHRWLTEQMYTEILDAVAAVAKERRYDMILSRDVVDITSQTTQELFNKIAQRKCLYYAPSIDLTDVVLERVNRQYAERQK